MNIGDGVRNMIGLYQVAKLRKQSPDLYFKFQTYQGDLLVNYLNEKKVQVQSCSVMDLGCGIGGYSYSLAKAGANVVSVDLELPQVQANAKRLSANAMILPFEDQTFDLVVCASLIEHVKYPNQLLDEIVRVTKPGGVIYLSYPPFYSPLGGHQFAPFHLLGESIALKVASWRGMFKEYEWLKEKYPEKPASFHEAFGRWGLYPLTIREIHSQLKKMPIDLIDQSTRWIPINFSKLPVLGEFFTWHVQFLFKRR